MFIQTIEKGLQGFHPSFALGLRVVIYGIVAASVVFFSVFLWMGLVAMFAVKQVANLVPAKVKAAPISS